MGYRQGTGPGQKEGYNAGTVRDTVQGTGQGTRQGIEKATGEGGARGTGQGAGQGTELCTKLQRFLNLRYWSSGGET